MSASIFSETELARLASFPEEIPSDDRIIASRKIEFRGNAPFTIPASGMSGCFDEKPERQLDQVQVGRLFTEKALGKDALRAEQKGCCLRPRNRYSAGPHRRYIRLVGSSGFRDSCAASAILENEV